MITFWENLGNIVENRVGNQVGKWTSDGEACQGRVQTPARRNTSRGWSVALASALALGAFHPSAQAAGSSASTATSAVKVAQAPIAAPATAPAVAPAAAPAAVPAPAAAPALSPNISKRLPELKTFATRMQVPYDQLIEGMEGLEQVYERRYNDARQTFRGMEQKYPVSAIGPFGLVMLAQAQMGENLDFTHETVYQAAYKESIKRMDAAVGQNQAVAWNRFLRGCAKGVNSLYMYRQDKLLGALQEGLGALSDIEAAKKLDPQFMDPYIGLGVYDYWRSAITLRYKNLPFFPDKRDQGLKELELARDKGVITPTMARLALGYSYLDKRLPEKALRETNLLKQSYPKNVLTLQLAGQVYTRLHLPIKARGAYEDVLAIDPRNVQAHLQLGLIDMNRDYNYPSAVTHLETYVSNLPNEYYRPVAHTRLGDAYWLSGNKSKAEEQWKLALKANPDSKTAKARMEGKRPKPRTPRPVAPATLAKPVNPPAGQPVVNTTGSAPAKPALTPAALVQEAAFKKAGIIMPVPAR